MSKKFDNQRESNPLKEKLLSYPSFSESMSSNIRFFRDFMVSHTNDFSSVMVLALASH